MAYNIVYRTGLFSDEFKTWRKKDAPDQTWTTFKAEFTLTHQDLRESQVTVMNAGYHNQANFTQENAMSENAEALAAIAGLDNAATSDRNTISTLTKTNAQLCKEISATNSKLADALERLENKQNPTETAPDIIAGPVEVEVTIPVVNAQTKKKDTSPLQIFETKKVDQTKWCFIKGDIVAVCVKITNMKI